MELFIIVILAVIGGLVILGGLAAGLVYWLGKRRVPAKIILEVNLERGFIEYIPDHPVGRIMLAKAVTVRELVEALTMAAEDRRVKGLIARVGGGDGLLAQVQEVRDAVLAFRRQGKPAVAYAETFGEFGPGNVAYYLACAFDEIYLQPSGDVGLTGFTWETPFFRGTLEKLGIVLRADHRREYKNFMNLFTERHYTEPHRQAVRQVMDSQFNQIVAGIAAARNLSPDEVRALIDRGPFLGQDAVKAKLVDGLAYQDEVYHLLKNKVGNEAKFLYLAKYLDRAGRPYNKGQTIALIYGVGGVSRGESKYYPAVGRYVMGADTVAAAFQSAVEDKKVKAILFRVDSPGGSYVASDTIWQNTLRARQAGKPVIVSMGNVAGSGGYFVSMAADKIVSQPGTITGSIGVVAGKIITPEFWEKLGVTWDEVNSSHNATFWSRLQDYTPEQWELFQKWLDRIYDDFIAKVSEGRNLPKEKVQELAKGRIWTGEDAKALGLVDELGGFATALQLARQAAGIADEAPIRLKVFPAKKSLWKKILKKGPDSSAEAIATAMAPLLQEIQPLLQFANEIRHEVGSEVLAMPALGRER